MKMGASVVKSYSKVGFRIADKCSTNKPSKFTHMDRASLYGLWVDGFLRERRGQTESNALKAAFINCAVG